MKWGNSSTGTIAKTFAQTAKQIPDVQVQAVASRSAGAPRRLPRRSPSRRRTTAMRRWQTTRMWYIVYVATPHSRHYEDMKLLIGAGKHVLCEKSFTTDDAEQAREIFALAKKKERSF